MNQKSADVCDIFEMVKSISQKSHERICFVLTKEQHHDLVVNSHFLKSVSYFEEAGLGDLKYEGTIGKIDIFVCS